jgi:hypothetical protein
MMTYRQDRLNLDRVEHYLANVIYPARQAEIIRYVKDEGAPGDVLELLERLPDRLYNSPTDVLDELQGLGR